MATKRITIARQPVARKAERKLRRFFDGFLESKAEGVIDQVVALYQEHAPKVVKAREPDEVARSDEGFDGPPLFEQPIDFAKLAAAIEFEKHQYSCALVLIPSPLDAELRQWAGQIDPALIIEAEDEPHVTVLYGLHTQDPDEVAAVVAGFGPITMTLGKTSLFSDETDVLKIDIESEDLQELNALLKTLDHTDTHPDYHPHLTLAYLSPGTGEPYVDDSSFEGREVVVDVLTFSQSGDDGIKTVIPLGTNLPDGANPPNPKVSQPLFDLRCRRCGHLWHGPDNGQCPKCGAEHGAMFEKVI